MGRADELRREDIVKPVDAWWTVLVVDPVAVRLVPPLARRPAITPMHLTTLAGALGVLCGILFLWGPLWVAGILFQARFVLDCLDGKLARATGRSTSRGASLDVLLDTFMIAWCHGAIGLRLTWEGVAGPPLVAALLGTSLVSAWMLQHRKGLATSTSRGGSTGEPTNARPASSRVRSLTRRHVAAMERRRLLPAPYAVEAEILVLSLAPITTSTTLVAAAAWVAVAFYVIASLTNAVRALRVAAAADAAPVGAGPAARQHG